MKALPLFLLLTYLVSGSGLEILLHSFHSHESAAGHSQEQEQDYCHRVIYHGDAENACDHKSHLVSNAKSRCELCDSICHTDHVFSAICYGQSFQFSLVDFVDLPIDFAGTSLSTSSSRAPPEFA